MAGCFVGKDVEEREWGKCMGQMWRSRRGAV